MMARQSGYYWVKELEFSPWAPAWYSGSQYNAWIYAGNPFRQWKDSDFNKINETRILAPDEVSDE